MNITKLTKSVGHKDYCQIDKLPIILDVKLANKLKNADSLAQIMPLICSNPSFYAHIVLLANAKARSRASDFECAENAASYLGFAHISHLYERLPKIASDELPRNFQHLLEQAQLAHQLVGHLIKSTSSSTKSLQGLAMLYHLPLWLLASQDGKEIQHFGYQRHFHPFHARYFLVGGQRDAFVSSEAFSEMTQNFPQRLLAIYSELLQEDTRSLTKKLCAHGLNHGNEYRAWFHRDCAKISLVHLLIESVFQPFYPRKMSKLIHGLCQAYDTTEQHVQTALFLTLKQSKRAQQSYLFLPSSIPFSRTENKSQKTQASESKLNKSTVKKPQIQRKQIKTSQRPRYDRETVMATMRKIQQNPLSLRDPNQALKQALPFLSKTFSFDRIVFALISPDQKRCKAKFSIGCVNNIALQKFNLNVKDYPILNKFVENSSFLVFERVRHETHWPRLPEFIHSDTSVQHFILHSLSTINNKPNLLVYIDNSIKGYQFEPELVKDYRQYMMQLIKAMRLLKPKARSKPA